MRGTSYAAQLLEWDLLLKAATAHEAENADVAPFRASLECSLALAGSTQKRRNALRAAAREATQEMNQAMRACSEAAMTLRCFVRATLGPRNENLVRYGIKPLRKRGNARKIDLPAGGPS